MCPLNFSGSPGWALFYPTGDPGSIPCGDIFLPAQAGGQDSPTAQLILSLVLSAWVHAQCQCKTKETNLKLQLELKTDWNL